jgi:hypothetical protein
MPSITLRESYIVPNPVPPANAGVYMTLKLLDPGACPGLDPGFAGMTLNAVFGLFTSSSLLNRRIQDQKEATGLIPGLCQKFAG